LFEVELIFNSRSRRPLRYRLMFLGSGTGKLITGTVYPDLPVPTFSFRVTLSPLHVAMNLTTG